MSTKLEPIGGLGTDRTRAQPVRRRGYILGRLVGYVAFVLLTAPSLFPLVWMILTSVRDRTDVLGGGLLPSKIIFDAYRFIFTELNIGVYFWNSVYITVVTVLVVVALATLAGYAFGRLEFW